ncbi:putative glutathione S-transferase, N-terminal domain [Lyophyllum shimeji]|uniref:Glutathione S-transferase, N-terminal domain n=1 Tax=Lyophyllum shimeji TaxID=47721 RepID=A0A9P3UQ17_LYOSH|nr:putative glutathione S-transferase, N-terminal domain [Lyophyllum shimeji]
MIVLYDIPSTAPGVAWSPNVWKTRYSLNYKGILYRTEWVEYPDIEATCKRIGAPYTEKREDGTPLYTLPAIHDPSTGVSLADSVLIAEYLDATYPDTPKLLPPGSRTIQHAFLAAYRLMLPALWQFALPGTLPILNPPSEAYFRRTKFGPMIPNVAPTGDLRQEQWAKLKDDFGLLAGWLDKGEADGPYILGDSASFLDFAVAGYIIWLRIIWGEGSMEWSDIKRWHNGRWDAFLKRLEKYETVV